MTQSRGTVIDCALTRMLSPLLAPIRPSISTPVVVDGWVGDGAAGWPLPGPLLPLPPPLSSPLPLPLPFPLPLPGLAGFPFVAVDTPPDWSLCEPSATTADGAVGFIDDFESLHAAVRPSAVT